MPKGIWISNLEEPYDFQIVEPYYADFLQSLLPEYDWADMGISIKLVDRYIIPKYGIEMVSWIDGTFRVVDPAQYTFFALQWGQGIKYNV